MVSQTAVAPDDRRQHQRSPYDGLLMVQSESAPTWFTVFGRDVSAGGFAFYSPVTLDRGERILINVPDLASTVEATVCHVAASDFGQTVGVQFDEILSPDAERCLYR